ncbi:MAG: acyl-CoA synthetase [Actinobacteria bacterium]|nr:acyl-CoA synthetase [Actinomycetota bacterium]
MSEQQQPVTGFYALAQLEPEALCVIEPDGTEHTRGAILGNVHRITHALRGLGLERGDVVAMLLPNSAEAIGLILAVMQSGWHLVPINWHLAGDEVAYIVEDSGARAFVAHSRFEDAVTAVTDDVPTLPAEARFSVGALEGYRDWLTFRDGHPDTAPDDRTAGGFMNYTSGTTGRPKGVERPLPEVDADTQASLSGFLNYLFGIQPGEDHVHLAVAPLYHTAVMQFVLAALQFGHTVVLMDKWTPEGTLERIERYRVTTSHMVPTMFNRMLKLPEDERRRYDVSSLTHVIHSAAPCPVPTKHAMLEWWGPVVYEYYAATEGGGTLATPEDWLRKPGTVGNAWPISEIKILDDDGNELPAGEIGTVWMKMGDRTFEYHGDEDKTKRTWNEQGFFTVGDVGELDEDGFLFLRDRKVDMIISGGVNIYPAEIESQLLQHEAVLDCAVFGVPNDDWGEEVKAAVQLVDPDAVSDDLAEELIAYCRDHLGGYKVPRTIDFHAELPRTATGKLLKRELRAPYWEGRDSALV